MNNTPLNLFTFPFWWYTTGWKIVWQWNKRQLEFGLHQTGLSLFARHLREPLYGDYTRSGIILGFFLRLILLGVKIFALLARVLMLAAADILFLLLPLVSLAMVVFQLATRS